RAMTGREAANQPAAHQTPTRTRNTTAYTIVSLVPTLVNTGTYTPMLSPPLAKVVVATFSTAGPPCSGSGCSPVSPRRRVFHTFQATPKADADREQAQVRQGFVGQEAGTVRDRQGHGKDRGEGEVLARHHPPRRAALPGALGEEQRQDHDVIEIG